MIFEPIVDSKRPYCGPRAISILTGVPTSRAEFMIRRIRHGFRDAAGRRRPIKGVWNSEVRKVLTRLGCKVREFKTAEPTIASFAADAAHAGTFLLMVTGHYVVIDAGMVVDSSTDMKPVPVAAFHKPLWRVQRAWRVIAPAVPRYAPGDPLGPRPRAAKPKASLRERRAAKIAAAIKRWTRKERLAKTKLRNLRRQAAYYARPVLSPVEAPAAGPG